MSSIKISRNAPCPCGSGKKYKKCCEKKDAVSIIDLIENEIIELQKESRSFVFNNFRKEMADDYKDLREMLVDASQGDKDFYNFIHPFWFLTLKTLADGETVMQKFIAQKLPSVTRPKVKAILQSWVDGKALAGKVIKVEEKSLVMEHAITGKEYSIYLPEHIKDYKEGVFVFGILLPYEEQFIALPALFDISNPNAASYADFIKSEFNASGFEVPEEFLAENLLRLMYETPNTQEEVTVNLDAYEWPNSGAKEVAEMFEKDMQEAGESQLVTEIGLMLWMDFCSKTNKRVQKPANYVAGLRYLVSTVAQTEETLTQKQLGEVYGITANRVSSYYSDIYNVIEDKIEQLKNETKEPVATV